VGLIISSAIPREPANYTVSHDCAGCFNQVAGYPVTSSSKSSRTRLRSHADHQEANSRRSADAHVANEFVDRGRRVQDFRIAYKRARDPDRELRSYDAGTQSAGPMLGDTLLTESRPAAQKTLSYAADAGRLCRFLYQTLRPRSASRHRRTDISGSRKRSPGGSRFQIFDGRKSSAVPAISNTSRQADRRCACHRRLGRHPQHKPHQAAGRITTEQNKLDAHMAQVQAAYLKQFTALDTLLFIVADDFLVPDSADRQSAEAFLLEITNLRFAIRRLKFRAPRAVNECIQLIGDIEMSASARTSSRCDRRVVSSSKTMRRAHARPAKGLADRCALVAARLECVLMPTFRLLRSTVIHS